MPDDAKKKQLHVHMKAEGSADPVKIELPIHLVPVFYLIAPGGEPVRMRAQIAFLIEDDPQ